MDENRFFISGPLPWGGREHQIGDGLHGGLAFLGLGLFNLAPEIPDDLLELAGPGLPGLI